MQAFRSHLDCRRLAHMTRKPENTGIPPAQNLLRNSMQPDFPKKNI